MTISKSHKTTAKGNTLRQFSRQNKVQLSCRCVSYVYVLILGILRGTTFQHCTSIILGIYR